jgi:hypothetical protein
MKRGSSERHPAGGVPLHDRSTSHCRYTSPLRPWPGWARTSVTDVGRSAPTYVWSSSRLNIPGLQQSSIAAAPEPMRCRNRSVTTSDAAPGGEHCGNGAGMARPTTPPSRTPTSDGRNHHGRAVLLRRATSPSSTSVTASNTEQAAHQFHRGRQRLGWGATLCPFPAHRAGSPAAENESVLKTFEIISYYIGSEVLPPLARFLPTVAAPDRPPLTVTTRPISMAPTRPATRGRGQALP